ncbi:MAG: hypothetical protein K0Q55_1276 [Verrucomicrobia bacterium]|jgi:hypothetical protein|nr:hypothetical protein [Verrucomicrobiota bacterium]
MPVTEVSDFVISFGDARAQFAYFIAMAVFFTFLAIGLFVLMCVETAFHKEIRSGFNKPVSLMKKSKGAMITFAVWFICVSWVYNFALGSKFVEVRRVAKGKDVTWEVTYHYPNRTVAIPETEIHRWTGAVDWSRKEGRHALVLELKNGEVLKSASMPPPAFKEKADNLAPYGITIPWGAGK